MAKRWRARTSRVEEVNTGKAYRDLGYARGLARASQVLRMMRSFARKNPRLARAGGEIFQCAFVGQLAAERTPAGKKVRCESTILGYLREIGKYGMRPDNLKEVAARLDLAALRAGISVKRREENPAIRHRILTPEIFLAPITRKGNVVIRAGIYLLLATGARAEHLSRIRDVQITNNAILVLWADRKVRERMNSYLVYPFEWSCRPPRDLEDCLRHWTERRTRLTFSAKGRYVVSQRINDNIGHIVRQGGWPDEQFLPTAYVHPADGGDRQGRDDTVRV